MHMRYFSLLTMICLSGCSSVGTIAEFSDLTIQVSEYKMVQAQEMGGIWLGTDTLLEQAKQAYASGDYKKALTASRQARFESETALEQNLSQQDAVPWQF